jgi:hypothetical protein
MIFASAPRSVLAVEFDAGSVIAGQRMAADEVGTARAA